MRASDLSGFEGRVQLTHAQLGEEERSASRGQPVRFLVALCSALTICLHRLITGVGSSNAPPTSRAPVASTSNGARSHAAAPVRRAPAATAVARTGSGAGGASDLAVQRLTNELGDMRINVEGLEKERNFYFVRRRVSVSNVSSKLIVCTGKGQLRNALGKVRLTPRSYGTSRSWSERDSRRNRSLIQKRRPCSRRSKRFSTRPRCVVCPPRLSKELTPPTGRLRDTRRRRRRAARRRRRDVLSADVDLTTTFTT